MIVCDGSESSDHEVSLGNHCKNNIRIYAIFIIALRKYAIQLQNNRRLINCIKDCNRKSKPNINFR